MGGAVSSGRDNNELIDNLMGGNYIRTRSVERVFRALDRADYMTPETRDQAYKDLAWRNGPLHMSAPCIYSEVMEGLELRPGLSFLNVGSGTGYLSTLVGLIIGSGGISHGVEVHPMVVEYANKKNSQFIENSPTLDEFDFCEPKYYHGNGLCLAPLQAPYDRVYCGAGCPDEYQNYFKQLIKVGGVLVMPLNDSLLQVRRVADAEWVSRSMLNVSFAALRVPTKEEAGDLLKLEEQCPPRLQVLSRAVVRAGMRGGLLRRHPELREPPPRQPPAKKSCPRRICIPIEDDSDVGHPELSEPPSSGNTENSITPPQTEPVENPDPSVTQPRHTDGTLNPPAMEEGLNALHDLESADGAHEMNALLSLVLSMGQNRVAGTLRFDRLDSPPIDSSTDVEDEATSGGGDDGNDDDGGGGGSSGSGGGGGGRGDGGGAGGGGGRRGGGRPKSSSYKDASSPDRPRQDPSSHASSEEGAGAETSAGAGAGAETSAGARAGAEAEAGSEAGDRAGALAVRSRHGLFTFEFRDMIDSERSAAAHSSASSSPAAPGGSGGGTGTGSGTGTGTGTGTGSATRKSDKANGSKEKRDGDNTDDSPGVPAEVEIYLGKSSDAEAGPSGAMDWEAEAEDECSSEEEASTRADKRQKLDSGIGEGTTPTSDSSPAAARADDSDADAGRSGSLTDDADSTKLTRRRLQKRGRFSSGGVRSSTSTDGSGGGGSGSGSGAGSGSARRRCKRRAGEAPSGDARRVRLSVLMKRGVKELPLPYALKKYVNLGRCFEF